MKFDIWVFFENLSRKFINFGFMVPYIVMITLNKNAKYMYFVLKILKILFTLFRSTCFGHHCAHHQEELLSCTCSLWSRVVLGSLCPPVLLCCNSSYIIRSFSAAHAVSGPVWCLVCWVLQSCCVVTAVTTAAEKLLMMDTMVSETCRAE